MWKACRAQEKALREMMSEQRKRAERRAAYFAQKVLLMTPQNCDYNLNKIIVILFIYEAYVVFRSCTRS